MPCFFILHTYLSNFCQYYNTDKPPVQQKAPQKNPRCKSQKSQEKIFIVRNVARTPGNWLHFEVFFKNTSTASNSRCSKSIMHYTQSVCSCQEVFDFSVHSKVAKYCSGFQPFSNNLISNFPVLLASSKAVCHKPIASTPCSSTAALSPVV